MKTATHQQVRALFRSTGFDEEEPYGADKHTLYFATRENGDVGEGKPGAADIAAARELRTKVQAIPGVTRANVDMVDEWVSVNVEISPAGTRAKSLKVGDAVELPNDPGLVGTIARLYNNGTSSESAEVHVAGYAPSYHPTRTLKKTRRRPRAPAARPAPRAATVASPQKPRRLQPGDEIKYTNFTVGGSYEGKAIVTWDHGKSVEARTLGGERIRLERAQDGSLRRFT